jgi:membrane protein required for colicin V production
MNLFDIALLIAAVVSVIVGAVRGFVKEAAALAGWVLAVVLVMNASVSLGQRLPFEAGSIGVRTGIAAILIVLVCVLTAHLVGRSLRAAVAAAQLSGADRALGALFGIGRAAAVWLLVALVVIHVGLAERPFWRSSRLAPSLEAALRLISPDLAPSMHRPIVAQGV